MRHSRSVPGRGPDRGVQVRQAYPAGNPGGPQCLDSQAVRQELVVDGGQGIEHQPAPRCMHPQGIPVQGHRDRFIQGDPLRHPVPDRGGPAVLGKPLRGVPVQPPRCSSGSGVSQW